MTAPRTETPPLRLERAAMAAILALAAAIRFWRLETPSMWWDEILIPMVARLPLPAIIERSLTTDFHPPGFYVLIKAVLALGGSDFALRLAPALAGVAGVWLVHRLGRSLLGPAAGLAAAALLAVNPLCVLLSRQVRPYTLIMLLAMVAFSRLVAVAREGRWPDLAALGLANIGLALLHHLSVLVIGAQGLALLILAMARRTAASRRTLFVYTALAALAAGLVAPFLLAGMGETNISPTPAPGFFQLAGMLAELTAKTLHWDIPAIRLGLFGLALFGFLRLYRSDRLTAFLAAVFVLAPLAVILAAGYSTYLNPWHFSFLLPVLALLCGHGLAALGPRPAAALALAACLAGGAAVFLETPRRYFGPTAHGGSYKSLARALPGRLASGPGMAVFSAPGLANAVNWYADRYARPNPLVAQRLDSQDPVRVLFVSQGDVGHLAKDLAELETRLGRPAVTETVDGTLLHGFDLPRSPRLAPGPLPVRLRLAMTPEDVYARAARLENLTVLPYWGCRLIPTANDLDGLAEYEFAPPEGAFVPLSTTVYAGFVNEGLGNVLEVQYAFDDEPFVVALRSDGPDPRGDDKFSIDRDRPYARFRLRFRFFCAGLTPRYPGGNLETLALKDFKVHQDPIR